MELAAETVAIITVIFTVGVVLAGLILHQSTRIDAFQAQMEQGIDGLRMRTQMERRIGGLQTQTERRFDGLQAQTDRRFDALREQNNHLQERVARIEGILTGRPLLADEPAEARATS